MRSVRPRRFANRVAATRRRAAWASAIALSLVVCASCTPDVSYAPPPTTCCSSPCTTACPAPCTTAPARAACSEEQPKKLDFENLDFDNISLDDINLDDIDLDDLQPAETNPLAGCVQCHVDVSDEFEGGKHHCEEITCIDCHGPSEGHLADENNDVKPDEVFARADVGRLCSECHDCDRPLPDKPSNNPTAKPKVCIDCHGSHKTQLTGGTSKE